MHCPRAPSVLRRGRPRKDRVPNSTDQYVQALQKEVLRWKVEHDNVVDSRNMLLSEREENQHLRSEIQKLRRILEAHESQDGQLDNQTPSVQSRNEEVNGVRVRESTRTCPLNRNLITSTVAITSHNVSPNKSLLSRENALTRKELDFIGCFENLNEAIERLSQICGSFIADAGSAESPAESYNVSDPIRTELLINESFSTPYPHVISQAQTCRITADNISWADLIRKEVPETKFQRQAENLYHCLVEGAVIEMSKGDYYALCSSVLLKLLPAWVNHEDRWRERDARSPWRTYLARLRQGCLRGEKCQYYHTCVLSN